MRYYLMIGKFIMLLRYVLPFMFIVAGCAIDPVSTNDYSGLGKSELGKTLSHSIFLGESAVNFSVKNLVNKPEILKQNDPRPELQKIGFDCQPFPAEICSYSGYAKSEIQNIERSNTVRFTTKIHVQATLAHDSINIQSKIIKSDY